LVPTYSAYANANQATANYRRLSYEETRDAVVELVTWERLRAKRETLAADVPNQRTSLKANVQQMADQFKTVNLSHLQYAMPERYYNAWLTLHPRMILAQGEWEKRKHGLLSER
jgi:transcription-repair coupling factor (superfamily II helicase)